MTTLGINPFYCTNETENIYTLNLKKLKNNEYNVFFPMTDRKALIAMIALELFTFIPSKREINARLKFTQISIGGEELLWCHFPREFEGACKNAIAAYIRFQPDMVKTAIYMWNSTEEITTIVFPKKDNILLIDGGYQIKDHNVSVTNREAVQKEFTREDFLKEERRLIEASDLFAEDTVDDWE